MAAQLGKTGARLVRVRDDSPIGPCVRVSAPGGVDDLYLWIGYGGGALWCGCAHHDAHWQTVLEPVSLDEALPDLVEAAAPDGVGVGLWVCEETLETRLGGGGCARGRGGGGGEPAGTAGSKVVGARWGQWESHIEQVFRTGLGTRDGPTLPSRRRSLA